MSKSKSKYAGACGRKLVSGDTMASREVECWAVQCDLIEDKIAKLIDRYNPVVVLISKLNLVLNRQFGLLYSYNIAFSAHHRKIRLILVLALVSGRK